MVATIKEIVRFHLPWSVVGRKNCFYGTQYQNQNGQPIKYDLFFIGFTSSIFNFKCIIHIIGKVNIMPLL